jgi:hypothetical protein
MEEVDPMARSHRPRLARLLVPLALTVAVAALTAPAASAAAGTATATITPSTPGAGTTSAYTFTLAPASGQISSFNLSAASGWTITSLDAPPSGVTSTSTTIQGRGVSASASAPLVVAFHAQAPCATANATWAVAAKTGANFTGSSFTISPQPSTPLSGMCSASFVTGRGPADAALNGGSTSQNITSVPYTPGGDAIRVEVRDASGAHRGGIGVTLALSGPSTQLNGPKTAISEPDTTSADFGIATFQGSAQDPLTIATIGQGYVMTPSGDGVDGSPSDAFGIYQEGKPCTTAPCTAHGHSGDNKIRATVSAGAGGNLGVLVADLNDAVSCTSSIPAGYDYTSLSAQVTVWKYTVLDTSQTIQIFVDKSIVRTVLNRGSDHIDFCLDSEGKTFVDKFGVSRTNTPGLLPDCNTVAVEENCILSETASGGGGRLITVTVKDGKGRI